MQLMQSDTTFCFLNLSCCGEYRYHGYDTLAIRMAGTLTLSRVMMMLTLMLIDFNVNQVAKANAQTSKERKVLRNGFLLVSMPRFNQI